MGRRISISTYGRWASRARQQWEEQVLVGGAGRQWEEPGASGRGWVIDELCDPSQVQSHFHFCSGTRTLVLWSCAVCARAKLGLWRGCQ